MTLADRVSKKTLIAHAPSKHAEVVTDAIIQVAPSRERTAHTITVIAKNNKINNGEISWNEMQDLTPSSCLLLD